MSLIVSTPLSGILKPASVVVGGCGSPPGGISGLFQWLDASSLDLDEDDEIDTWIDCSGNGIDATGVVVATKPLYKGAAGPNSKPAVLLADDTGDPDVGGYFSLPNAFGSLTETHGFAVVKKILANEDSTPPFADFGSDLSGDLYAFNDGRIFSAFGSTVRKEIAAGLYVGTYSITDWLLIEFRSASGHWSFWINGDEIFSTAVNTVGWGTAPFIGHRTAGNANCRALVAETPIYDHILSGGEYTTFKSYITTKYALILA